MIEKVVDTLEKARDLISRGWCQLGSPLDINMRPIGLFDEGACRFPLEWAIVHAAHPEGGFFDVDDAVTYFEKVADCQDLVDETKRVVEFVIGDYPRQVRKRDAVSFSLLQSWNDAKGRTRDEVLDLLERSISVAGLRLDRGDE